MQTLTDEVQRGWQLVLPIDQLHLIPDVEVLPMGTVEQLSINEQGAKISNEG